MSEDQFAIQRVTEGDYLTVEGADMYGWNKEFEADNVKKFFSLGEALAFKRGLPPIGSTLVIVRLPTHGAGKCG